LSSEWILRRCSIMIRRKLERRLRLRLSPIFYHAKYGAGRNKHQTVTGCEVLNRSPYCFS
jgi:hypothetical protein